jgi:uncharacterized Zn finger protein
MKKYIPGKPVTVVMLEISVIAKLIGFTCKVLYRLQVSMTIPIEQELRRMRTITEDEVQSAFSEKTYLRGLNYFESGHVEIKVKKGNSLTGTVQGTMQYPYRVEVDLEDGIYSRCTCPVGGMCKHGVALLLQWIHDNDSFVDFDQLLTSLQKKSNEELLKIITSLLESNPDLISKLAFSEKIREKNLDKKVISQRLDQIGRGFFDYYAVPGVVKELEDIKAIGDTLAEEGCFSDAEEVYLSLIEWGVDAYESGTDDSDGSLGDIVLWCVEDFTSIAGNLGEEQKKDLIHRVLDIIKGENYGLETEELLYGLATKENIFFIEEELMKRIPTNEYFSVEYRKRETLELLSRLYGELGMQDDALRVIKEAGLESTGEYVLMAEVLMGQDEHEKALDCVREGMRVKEDEMNTRPEHLYFALLHRLLSEKRVDVSVEEALNAASRVLSKPFYFNSGRYAIIKDVFERIGEYKRLIATIKKKCEENTVIDVLLYEDCIEEAIDRALSSPTLYPLKLIDVAEAAQKKGKPGAAKNLTIKALKKGLTSADAPVDELVTLVVAESDKSQLEEAITSIRSVSIAKLFVEALLEKNQELAVRVLKGFIYHVKKRELLKYAANLEDVYVKEVYRVWISEAINRSYVYYDDAVDILTLLKGITPEGEWQSYMSTVMEENRGKKKLLEKIDAVF